MQSIIKVAEARLALNNILLQGWRRKGVIKSERVLLLMVIVCRYEMG